MDEEWVEVEVVGRSKKQIGPDTQQESIWKNQQKNTKQQKKISTFSRTSSRDQNVEEKNKNNIFNFNRQNVKSIMNNYDPFFPSSRTEKENESPPEFHSPHLPNLNLDLSVRHDGNPTVVPKIKQVQASPTPTPLPRFHTYKTSQRRSNSEPGIQMRNRASYFEFGLPSNGNIEVVENKIKNEEQSSGRTIARLENSYKNSKSNKKLRSKEIVRNEKIYANESEKLLAEALEKMKQKRSKYKEKNIERNSQSSQPMKQYNHQISQKIPKPSRTTNKHKVTKPDYIQLDYESEPIDSELNLIEQANISDFLKI